MELLVSSAMCGIGIMMMGANNFPTIGPRITTFVIGRALRSAYVPERTPDTMTELVETVH